MQASDFNAILDCLQAKIDLKREEMRNAIGWILNGRASEAQIRTFLHDLSSKGETIDELTGAAQALRDSMIPVVSTHRPILDTCGTGGDGAQTFNISTAAALAIAAAGVAVAKHGNRKITSSTGSADVLSQLGIDLEATPQVVQKCLEELGICFCFAPHFHPAMRHVGAVRRELRFPTIFNRLGPLANPAGAHRQILGVGDASLQLPMARALQQLGTERSLIVRGVDGVDELSLSSETRVLEVTRDSIAEHLWSPDDFGIRSAPRETLFAADPVQSAACIRSVFSGKLGPQRDVVVMNAAAGLWLADFSHDLRECAARVSQAIDSGAAEGLVESLARATSAPEPI
jgi:anthranilate phosphoribosyltransferase